jgi:hypothetical protein
MFIMLPIKDDTEGILIMLPQIQRYMSTTNMMTPFAQMLIKQKESSTAMLMSLKSI